MLIDKSLYGVLLLEALFFLGRQPMACSSATPKLIVPEEKSSSDTIALPLSSSRSPSSERAAKKLTKILSAQSSFERHHPPHPIGKRFSIDADPSAIILNAAVHDLSNYPYHQALTPDLDSSSSSFIFSSASTLIGKDPSPARSPSLKKSDSFLEIPYEKAEIVDLINLVDDPNAATHISDDGHEVLLEHSVVP